MWTNVNYTDYTFCRSAAVSWAFHRSKLRHGVTECPKVDSASEQKQKDLDNLLKDWCRNKSITIYRIFPGYVVKLTEVALLSLVRCFSIQVSLRYQWWNNVLKRSQKWNKNLLFPAGWRQNHAKPPSEQHHIEMHSHGLYRLYWFVNPYAHTIHFRNTRILIFTHIHLVDIYDTYTYICICIWYVYIYYVWLCR